MFIDASAIVAIVNAEPGSDQLLKRIEDYDKQRFVSPMVRFESITSIARARSGKHKTPSASDLDDAKTAVEIVIDAFEARDITISSDVGELALKAAQTYGRHVGHKAKLNMGDCFAYACAKAYHAPLVYVGNDFSQTDLA